MRGGNLKGAGPVSGSRPLPSAFLLPGRGAAAACCPCVLASGAPSTAHGGPAVAGCEAERSARPGQGPVPPLGAGARPVAAARMPPFCHAGAVLLILLAIAMVMAAEQGGEKSCDLVGDKDKESKTEKELLKKLGPLMGARFHTDVVLGTENYTYEFRVCREVSSALAESGVVQTNGKTQKKTVIGRINETQIINGSDWILLIYKGGDSYGSHCLYEKRKALIMISCNRKARNDSFIMAWEERDKEQECFYLFEMDSSVACPPEDSHLSIGSILLITLASVIAVYIVGGFLYQRLVVGAKGMEQFPHFAFWQDLGNLVADGCDFVCRSKPRNAPAAYRGVGDDQLGEESEERDDHLLPM